MNYEFFIAKRYLSAKRKQAFISVITIISTLGIMIGVMALVIAMALITGFQSDVQDKILGTTSHIIVSDFTGEGLIDYTQLISRINDFEEVTEAVPVIYDTVLLSGPYKSSGAILRGIDFDIEKRTAPWLQKLDQGSIPSADAKREEILLGREVAFRIGASVGDVVTVLTSSSRLSPIGLIPKTKRFVVVGIFSTGLYEYDSSTALISLNSAQKFFDLEGRATMIQIKIKNIFRAQKVSNKIKEVLPPETYVTTWMELNRSLFSALKLEKKLMFFVISLIIFVASLNIIASLILMVMEKTRDIGVLIAMGATSKNIKKIFFYQGAMIGVIGTSLGVFFGLTWCWLANTFELIRVPVDIYQISYVPFYINIRDVSIIIGVSLLISFLSTLFPSHRASKVDPVVALKYE
ncbi:MAG: ABC transporter permease [Candidatus Aminicenantes bacterium]|nr:ABC transporter permease [Candidatus Aminicenantes bacterium]